MDASSQSRILLSASTSLSAVATVSANDVWAVGSGVTASNKNEQLIEHWDGKTWTIVANPTISQGDSALSGVAAISASDVWAVGGPLIEHWDGVAWKVVSNPGASSNGFLNAIAAISSKDVWAVGSGNGALIEHWDGATWKVVPVVTATGDEWRSHWRLSSRRERRLGGRLWSAQREPVDAASTLAH